MTSQQTPQNPKTQKTPSSSAREQLEAHGYAFRSDANRFSEMGFFAQFLAAFKGLLTHPTRFFQQQLEIHGSAEGFAQNSLPFALAFALVVNWISSALGYIWVSASVSMVQTWLERAQEMAQMFKGIQGIPTDFDFDVHPEALSWFFGLGSVIANPFFTLIGLLFSASLITLGAVLLIPGARDRFRSVLKICCFAMAPAIFNVIPFVGWLIAAFASFFITATGVQEVFKVGKGRAMTVALFPSILVLSVVLTIVGVAFFLAMRFFATAMG